MRSSAAAALIALAGLGSGLLVTGWAGLEAPLPGGLPLGNALSAAVLVFIAAAALLLSRGSRFTRGMSIAALLLAALWLPVSVMLAGNAELNFSGTTGTAWLAYSAATLLAALGALLLALAGAFRSRRRI